MARKSMERKARRAGGQAGGSWKFGGSKIIIKKLPSPALDQQTLPPYIEGLKRDAVKEITRVAKGRTRREENLSILIAELKERVAQLKQALSAIDITSVQPPVLSQKIYHTIMVALSSSEFAINMTAFQVLSQSWPLTIVMGLFLLIGFPLITHFAGSSIRQNKNWIGLWVALPVSFLTFIAVAIVRVFYFEAARSQHLLGISVSPPVLAAITIIFNLFIVVAAIIAAFLATSPNETEYKLLKELREKEVDLAAAIEEYNKLMDKKEAVMEMIALLFEKLCFVFDLANQRAREAVDPGQPEWVKFIPKLQVPVLERI